MKIGAIKCKEIRLIHLRDAHIPTMDMLRWTNSQPRDEPMTSSVPDSISSAGFTRLRRRSTSHSAWSVVVAFGLLGILTALLPGTAQAMATTYNVNLSDPNETITGSITTNGAIGSLAISDIQSWSFDASGVTGSFNVASSETSASISCPTGLCGLNSSSSQLFLDTSSNSETDFIGTYGEIVFSANGGASPSYYVSADYLSPTSSPNPPYTISVAANTAIASVPEPTEALLMMVGLGLLGLVGRPRSPS